MQKFFMVLATGALLVGTSASAACWPVDEVNAAKVRNLQTMLMVNTLRCQMVGVNVATDYNNFLQANRTAIGASNDRLKRFFIQSKGPVEGQRAYDAFTTQLANSFGSSRTNSESCAATAEMAREGQLMANSAEGLLMIADRQGLSPIFADGACTAPELFTRLAVDTRVEIATRVAVDAPTEVAIPVVADATIEAQAR